MAASATYTAEAISPTGQHLRVVAHPGRVGVRVVALPRPHLRDGLGDRGPADAHQGREQVELVERRLEREPVLEREHVVGVDPHVGERVVPLPVPFCPNPSQSSTTVTPAARVSTMAIAKSSLLTGRRG